MKNRAIKIIFMPVVGLLFMMWHYVALAQTLIYQVHIDKNNPHQGKIIVDTSSLQTFELLPARSMKQSMGQGTEQNLEQNKKTEMMIICDDKKSIPLDSPLLLQCDQVSWEISFLAFDVENEDISQQDNLFITQPQALWILTEWDTLPRFDKYSQVSICMSDGVLSRCHPLPTQEEAPLIIPFGHKKNVYQLENININLFAALNAQHEQRVLEKYEEIIAYLASILPKNLQTKEWDVIWLPAEISRGKSPETLSRSIGGAAGHSSFMANYPIENGQWTEQSEEWLLKISAHETFHILSRLDTPLWVGESLAEYYAFKALNASGILINTPLQTFLKSKTAMPHSKKNLYYAGKRISAPHNDMSFYPLLYHKGSAFWYEVDMALQSKGRKLDDYLRLLDGLTFVEGELPETFETMLKNGMSAPIWQKIKQKYLLN